MFYLLPIGEKVELKQEFKAENIIVFQSAKLDLTPSSGTGIDNTYVNIISADNNILLHISIRRAQNAIVLNSRTADGPWGTEERVTLEGRFVNGLNTTITVYDHGDRFQVLIDYNTIHYYEKRIQRMVLPSRTIPTRATPLLSPTFWLSPRMTPSPASFPTVLKM
jgi:hypothetical protein